MPWRSLAPDWLKHLAAAQVYNRRLALVPGSLADSWPQRMFLKRFLADLEIDCVLDVGANVGQYGSELRRIGYRGLIVSFEPNPAAFEALRLRSDEDGRWQAFNLALGSEAGHASFNVMANSVFSSFLQPSEVETDHHACFNRVQETIQVEVARLSEVLPSLRAAHDFARVFLKMDTQGFDSQVFAGASEVRDQIDGMQSEVGIKRIYQGTPLWSEQIQSYASAGFDLAGVYAVNPSDPDLVELDCYFRRRRSGRRE